MLLGQVPSLCDHPLLYLFCSYPNYDPSDPFARTPIRQSEIRWPDVEFLFGDDVEHQDFIVETLHTVNRALNNVHVFTQVSLSLFVSSLSHLCLSALSKIL